MVNAMDALHATIEEFAAEGYAHAQDQKHRLQLSVSVVALILRGDNFCNLGQCLRD
jgi:hypothetical protein